MVTVPTTPGNSVRTQQVSSGRLRYAPTQNLVGQAVEGFGRQLQQAGEDFDRIEATYDQADVLNLDNTFASEVSATRSEFKNLRGDQPGRELQDRLKALQDRAEELASGARSERAANMTRRALSVRVQNAQEDLTGHADRQMFEFRDAALVAGRNQAVDDAIDQYGSQEFSVAMGVGLTRIEELASHRGLPPEVLQLEQQSFLDEVHGGVVDQMFAVPDPSVDEIAEYVAAYGEQMTPELRAATMSRLQDPLQGRMARSDADAVMSFAVSVPAEPDAPAGESPNLDAITAQAESGNRDFNTDGSPVTSPVGARFAMQVMPATARDPGFGLRPADPNDPDDMNRLGREYRAEMEQRYDGDLAKMWAAYNWGPGAVDKAVEQHGDQWLDHAPAETRSYVLKNIAEVGGETSSYANAPREWDRAQMDAALNQAAETYGWSPERTDRARQELDRRTTRDENLLREQQADADEAAAEIVLARGEGFTSPNMIPREVWAKMSVGQRASVEATAERNRQPVAPSANGADAISLSLMPYYEPEEFKRLDLSQYVGKITPGELESAMTRQARMRTAADNGEGWSPRSGIVTALNYGITMNPGILGTGDKAKEQRAAILQIMEAEAIRLRQQNGGKDLTEQEYQGLFRSATREIQTRTSFMGIPTGESERRRFELTLGMMPTATRAALEDRLEASGMEVNDDNLLRLYRTMPR